MNKIVLILSSIFLLIILSSCSATKHINNQQIAVTKKDTIHTATQQPSLLEDPIINNAHVGICVYELATNTYLYNYQGNKYFVPASNTKIATCYAAMKYLGDSLLGLEYAENDSDIYIQGTGDPSFLYNSFLSQPVFYKLKNTRKNIYVINNSNNKFKVKPLGKGWNWDDYLEPYMAERSAFPLYGNTVKFYQDKQDFKTSPPYFEKFFDKLFDTNGKNVKFNVTRNYGENSFFFNINTGTKNDVEITYNTNTEINPPHILLTDTLKKNIRTIGYKNTNKKIYSQPTDSLLKPMMHNSDNFFAEQTLLMVSLNQLGYMSDEKIIDTLLKTEFKDLPQKPRWVDGSGLSRYNLFSPEDFVFILSKMKNEFSWQRIATIFPTGNEGTLKGYYKKYQNKIFAKTGTISNNLSLSGFIKANSGKDYIFSIIINNHQSSTVDIRLAIEKFIAEIIENK